MKYIFITLLMLTTLFANDKNRVTLGVGPYIQTQPYTGVDSKVVPSPVVFFDNSLFYIKWTRLGVYFLGDKQEDFSWGLSLTAQPRIYGYDSSDILGMDKRESSLEGGLAFSVQMDNTFFELIALTDIFDRHDSWVYNAELGYSLKLNNISIYPSILASYQSSKFTNYYYGVTQTEATKRSESAYIPSSGLQLGVQTYISYPLTNQLSVFVNMRADKLSNEATRSSIVSDDYIYSGLASLIYTFEY